MSQGCPNKWSGITIRQIKQGEIPAKSTRGLNKYETNFKIFVIWKQQNTKQICQLDTNYGCDQVAVDVKNNML